MSTGVRSVLDPWLGSHLPYAVYLPSVAVAAWMCGARPAVVAALASSVIALFLFAHPRGALPEVGSWEFAGLFVDLAVALVLVGLVLRQRAEKERARSSARRAEAEAALRAQREEELRLLNEGLEARVAERTRELSEANLRLRELDRLKGEFLSLMSHELRTPLNAILGFGEILTSGDAGPITEEQRHFLQIILNAGNGLHDLINSILTVSRLEAGLEMVTREPARMDWLINEEVAAIRDSLNAKGLVLRAEVPSLPELNTDSRKVRTIIANLLSNAVKFSPEGEIHVRAEADETQVHVRVGDSCPGLSESESRLVFEPFTQLESPLCRSQEGAGIGLYLSRKLARLLGGDVDVDTSVKAGCEFVLHLPLDRAA